MIGQVYIAPISWGLGDLIVSLPVVQALINEGRPTWLVTRSYLQEGLADRIEGLSGAVCEETFISSSPQGKYFNLRAHKLQTDYWWGTPEFRRNFPTHRINDILRDISCDFGIKADFDNLRPLLFKPRAALSSTAVFLPGSDGSYKCWPASHWIELHGYLKACQQEVVMVGQPDHCPLVKELIDAGLTWYPTPTLADCVDVISSCKFVVGGDTGLMHLAVQQATPTIALYRFDPIYMRPGRNVYPLIASSCPEECSSKSSGGATNTITEFKDLTYTPWNCSLPDSQRCMGRISTEAVVEALIAADLIKGRIAAGRNA